MTAVMEEMSMDKEEESLGPFFLEHFDNSEYTMAVPGEGVRHTSFFLSTVVLKALQIDKVTNLGVPRIQNSSNLFSRLVRHGWTA